MIWGQIMTYESMEEVAFRQRLLTSPGERGEVDYKASARFDGNDSYTLKLIRHIQGMANSVGGWLVIGYVESRNTLPELDPNHSEEICASYDPTQVTNRVNSFIARRQRIDLTIYFEIHPDTGIRHPIIQVNGFDRLPYVCRSDQDAIDSSDRILRQGAVYLRRSSAETSEVSTPEDWEDLVNRCVRLRRDEFLIEFRELFERMTAPELPTPSTPSPSTKEELLVWMDQIQKRSLEEPEKGEGR